MRLGKNQEKVLRYIIDMGGIIGHKGLMRVIYRVYKINTHSLERNRGIAGDVIKKLKDKGFIIEDGSDLYRATETAYRKLEIPRRHIEGYKL